MERTICLPILNMDYMNFRYALKLILGLNSEKAFDQLV